MRIHGLDELDRKDKLGPPVHGLAQGTRLVKVLYVLDRRQQVGRAGLHDHKHEHGEKVVGAGLGAVERNEI